MRKTRSEKEKRHQSSEDIVCVKPRVERTKSDREREKRAGVNNFVGELLLQRRRRDSRPTAWGRPPEETAWRRALHAAAAAEKRAPFLGGTRRKNGGRETHVARRRRAGGERPAARAGVASARRRCCSKRRQATPCARHVSFCDVTGRQWALLDAVADDGDAPTPRLLGHARARSPFLGCRQRLQSRRRRGCCCCCCCSARPRRHTTRGFESRRGVA